MQISVSEKQTGEEGGKGGGGGREQNNWRFFLKKKKVEQQIHFMRKKMKECLGCVDEI